MGSEAGAPSSMRRFRTLPRTAHIGWDLGLFEVMEPYMAVAVLLYIVARRRRSSPDAPGGRGA